MLVSACQWKIGFKGSLSVQVELGDATLSAQEMDCLLTRCVKIVELSHAMQ